MVRRWCFAIALTGAMLGSLTADAAPRKLGVGGGPSAAAVSAALGSSLPAAEWSAETLTEGLQKDALPLDAAIARPKERTALGERARAAGARAHADAVVLVRVARLPKARRVTHVVVAATGTESTREVQVMLPLAASKGDGDKLVAALLPTLPATAASATPAAPALQPDAEPQLASPSPPSASPAPAPAAPRPADADMGATLPLAAQPGSVVRLALVSGVASRTFTYRDALSPGLRTYSLAAVPTLGGRLDVFPLARSRAGIFRGLGAYGDIAMALGLSSESTSKSGSSRWTRWDAGAHFLGAIGHARIGGAVGYGRETFGFDLAGVGTLPSTDYSFVRPALEGGFDVGRFAIDLSGAYLAVLDGGALAARARDTSVAGVEGRALVRYALGRHVDVSLGGVYTRFFYAFKPQPGDDFVSGGALDQVMRGELALAGRY